MNDEKERKELMEAIRFLLRTTEELKAKFTPLIRNQKDAFKILKSHEEAITRVMDKLIGTQKDHKKTLKSLELLRTQVSEIGESVESHEQLGMTLQQRLKSLEFAQIRQILVKIYKQKPVSGNDLKVVEGILPFYPDDEYLSRVKSDVLERLGRKQEALEFLEEAISKYPNASQLWYRKGRLLEDFNEKVKCFEKSLELLKDGSRVNQHLALFALAAQFAIAQRFEEALEFADRSVEMAPDCWNAWIQKGKILIDLDRIPESLGCFEKAIKLKDDLDRAWFARGIALSALGTNHLDEALASYDKAIELNPKLAEAYFNKGKLLIDRKQYEKALQTIDKGLEIDNKEPCGWCDRGMVLGMLKRNEEALASFIKALELSPPKDCYQIFENKAIILFSLGRDKEAVEMFDKIFKEAETFEELPPQLLNTYAYSLYENTKRYKEGAAIARKAVDAEPQNAMFWDTLACNLVALGNDMEAFEAFKKALSLKKNDKEITWNALAKLYERMGKAKEAEQAYHKFKSIEKESKQASDMEQ